MSQASPADDLPKSPVPETRASELGRVEALQTLFRWVESEALLVHGWYLKEKESKAKISKRLRVLTICIITTGVIFPILALLSNGKIRPEWGYVAFALSGGLVLLDKGFGYSSSWSRYMSTSASLGGVISRYQVAWAAWMLVAGSNIELDISEPLEKVIVPFATEVAELLEGETRVWATEFSENLSMLHSSVPAPTPNS
ncbi:SLATT domain-containing protein [Streptomyces sp. NPDC000888]